MAKGRFRSRLLASLFMIGGTSLVTAASPTPADMLQFKPRQEGIPLTTPADAQLGSCKVELLKGTPVGGRTPSGWIMKDGAGKPVRRFFDTDGDGKIDVWSYYLEGQEVYREMDTNANNVPDQFRWLGSAGSKWGVDVNEDGKIDFWKVISPEELSQEVLKAVATRDQARFQALLLSKAELDAFELPQSEAAKLLEKVGQATGKFHKTAATLTTITPKSNWLHLETEAPQTIPADELRSKVDLTSYRFGSILYDTDGKPDWLQTGVMLKVGNAWRLIDAPFPGSPADARLAPTSPDSVVVSAELKPLLEDLRKVDEKAPQTGAPADVLRYNLARAAVLETIIGKAKEEEREQWVKQLADCLSSAAQNSPAGDTTAATRLVQWRDHLIKIAPRTTITAYVVYREMQAEYHAKIAAGGKSDDLAKVQDDWREKLKKFVEEYPTAEDTPDAVMQLGMVHEFIGKEAEAKNWYGFLARNFEKSPSAAKAAGAVRRLSLDGQPIELAGPTLASGTPFDIATLKGKVVIVYYWASWNQQCVTDFQQIRAVLAANAGKGVELVTVNLDASAEEAMKFLSANPIQGTHLHQAGGLDSPLATSYGIMVLPSMFVIGKEGKVSSRSAQVGSLTEEVRKLTN